MKDTIRASVIELDSELASGLGGHERAQAQAVARARTRTLAEGEWDAIGEYRECTSWLGLLVVDGFLARRTTCGGETVIEIVGAGDLLRPWDHDDEYPMEGIQTGWQVLGEVRIALLDEGFAAGIAPWPPLTAAILARIGRRARWLGLRLLVSQIPGVEIRVLYLLWHLAERWGELLDERLRIPIPLTHEQIGELIGAQRPSVSHALSRLREEGVRRVPGEGWEIPLRTPEALGRMMRAGTCAFQPS